MDYNLIVANCYKNLTRTTGLSSSSMRFLSISGTLQLQQRDREKQSRHVLLAAATGTNPRFIITCAKW